MPALTKPKNTGAISVAACLVAIDKTRRDIQLFPSGRFDAPLGAMLGQGPWQLDADSAGRLIAAVSARKNDILIDYEHQSLTAAKNGHTAPAAGWINPGSLAWTDAGLYATAPDWKEKAAAMIDADEYRYLSPVFIYDETTGTPTNIISVALTNTPAIDGMAAVSLAALMAGTLTPEEPIMELSELMERLCYLLNLPLTITPQKMAGELDKLKTLLGAGDTKTGAASLVDVLAAKDAQIAALSTAAPDPAKYVPVETLLSLQQQHAQQAKADREQKVAALIAANPTIIIPAMESWAKQLGMSDYAQLEKYIQNTRPIAALTQTQTGGQAPAAPATQATDTDVTVMKCLGLTAEQFALVKAQE